MNIKYALLGLAFGLLSSLSVQAVTVINIDTDKPGAEINKNIYGHFAEHIGAGVYGGLWVGPDSSIPNTNGWRNDVVAALRELQVPVLRWPGGCFADDYHWRDGIGPRDQRPVRVNTLWGGLLESNAVGTHEFFQLADLLGAETYVNGNLGSGTPKEMKQWIEYLTSDSQSTLANERRKNGRDKPFKVDHFGIGNESWGCGGYMSPQHYTNLYKQWSTFIRPPWTTKINWVASGGHGYGDGINKGGETEWTDYLSKNIKPDFLVGMDAISFHYYTHPKGDVMSDKGAASGFPESEWISTLKNALHLDGLIAKNVTVLDRNDPENNIAFYVDEWGAWYNPEPNTNPAFLQQKNTLRDAMVAALHFNTFHKYAKRVKMANIAQMVNILHSVIETREEAMLLTPTYHAFHLYRPFMGARVLPVRVNKTPVYSHAGVEMPALSISAAEKKGGGYVLALLNSDANKTQEIRIDIGNKKIGKASARQLSAPALDAHNSFERPQQVVPEAVAVAVNNGELKLTLPAASITVIELQ